MEKYSFSQPVQIQNAAVDFRRRMKPSALLRCIEQISTDHACAYGMDDVFFAQQKAVFLLGKQALRFVRVPRRGEQMTLTTFAEQSRRGSLKRITELRGEDGQLAALVDAGGSWWIQRASISCVSRVGRLRSIIGTSRWRRSFRCTSIRQSL